MFAFFEKHRGLMTGLLWLVVIGLVVAYLFAFFTPGYWYWDAFLAKQSDGTFAGSGPHGNFRLAIDKDHRTVAFSIYNVTYLYEVSITGDTIRIRQDGAEWFSGSIVRLNGETFIADENGRYTDFTIRSGTPTLEELKPSPATLYNYVTDMAPGARGNAVFLIPLIILFLCTLAAFLPPETLWELGHGRFSDGGEPNDVFCTQLRIGRVVAILFLVGVALYAIGAV